MQTAVEYHTCPYKWHALMISLFLFVTHLPVYAYTNIVMVDVKFSDTDSVFVINRVSLKITIIIINNNNSIIIVININIS